MKFLVPLFCVLLAACSPASHDGTRLGSWTNSKNQTTVTIALATEAGDWPDSLTVTHNGVVSVFQGKFDAAKGLFIGPPIPGRPDSMSGAADIFAKEKNGDLTNNYILTDFMKSGDTFKKDL